jgi:hypothetical protein
LNCHKCPWWWDHSSFHSWWLELREEDFHHHITQCSFSSSRRFHFTSIPNIIFDLIVQLGHERIPFC